MRHAACVRKQTTRGALNHSPVLTLRYQRSTGERGGRVVGCGTEGGAGVGWGRRGGHARRLLAEQGELPGACNADAPRRGVMHHSPRVTPSWMHTQKCGRARHATHSNDHRLVGGAEWQGCAGACGTAPTQCWTSAGRRRKPCRLPLCTHVFDQPLKGDVGGQRQVALLDVLLQMDGRVGRRTGGWAGGWVDGRGSGGWSNVEGPQGRHT